MSLKSFQGFRWTGSFLIFFARSIFALDWQINRLSVWVWQTQESSGAVWKSRWPSWAPVPNTVLVLAVSVDVKQHRALNWLKCLRIQISVSHLHDILSHIIPALAPAPLLLVFMQTCIKCNQWRKFTRLCQLPVQNVDISLNSDDRPRQINLEEDWYKTIYRHKSEDWLLKVPAETVGTDKNVMHFVQLFGKYSDRMQKFVIFSYIQKSMTWAVC